ncbi:hypothetical protein OH77DRAFT_483639 [Trametes cingulata]|nr:hypothetical protein OH77DRAFT_483639 [Trametes cingulata]
MPSFTVTVSRLLYGTIIVVSFFTPLVLVAARSVNRTIDDQNGDSVTGTQPDFWPGPGVDPNSTWIQGIDCVHCSMLPHKVVDVSQTFDGTWHDSTYHPGNPDRGLTASFTGTAVYVFFLIPNFVQYTTTFTNLSFTIDGTYMNQFVHNPDSTSTILYQVPVFTATSLSNTAHTIEIRASGPTASILLFDYMAYTVEEADPPTTSASAAPLSSSLPPASPAPIQPQPTAGGTTTPQGGKHAISLGAIIGGVVGGVAFLALLGLLLCWLRKRRRRTWTLAKRGRRQDASKVAAGTLARLEKKRTREAARRVSSAHFLSRLLGETSLPMPPPAAVGGRGVLPQDGLPTVREAIDAFDSPAARGDSVVEHRSQRSSSCPSSIPDASSSAYTPSTQTGVSTLRAQVAQLQGEVERLRDAEREMHALFVEPPPRYEE